MKKVGIGHAAALIWKQLQALSGSEKVILFCQSLTFFSYRNHMKKRFLDSDLDLEEVQIFELSIRPKDCGLYGSADMDKIVDLCKKCL